jgi:hypothetical protein
MNDRPVVHRIMPVAAIGDFPGMYYRIRPDSAGLLQRESQPFEQYELFQNDVMTNHAIRNRVVRKARGSPESVVPARVSKTRYRVWNASSLCFSTSRLATTHALQFLRRTESLARMMRHWEHRQSGECGVGEAAYGAYEEGHLL